jgi:valyl-tRNA synthetase
VGAYKKFANKVWNIARFCLEQQKPEDKGETASLLEDRLEPKKLTQEDQKLLMEFEVFKADFLADMDNYRFHLASEKIYHYLWDTFASVIIEDSKALLASEDPSVRASRLSSIFYLLSSSLKLLHPFMPFITETIWREMGHIEKEDMLMIAQIR